MKLHQFKIKLNGPTDTSIEMDGVKIHALSVNVRADYSSIPVVTLEIPSVNIEVNGVALIEEQKTR